MSIETQLQSAPVDDGFAQYYAEKIWQLIPGIYRNEDAKSATPGALRAFVEVLAEQAAVERRSIDRLWADSNIVDCDDWVIPYIADLLGTRLISEQNSAGRRADVANTIKYRRHAGTLTLLSMLANDIAGWDAVPAEAFKRLWRNWHSLDCPAKLGTATASPQHGQARLDAFRIGELLNGPFDETSHLPDFRRLRGLSGRYNIPKVNLHVYRQLAFPLLGVTPHRFDATHYTLDPSGRDIPLFRPGRPISKDCKIGVEWEMRAPLSCTLFNDGRYAVTATSAAASIGAALLAIEGNVYRTADAIIDRAERLKGSPLSDSEGEALLRTALTADCNRANLFNQAIALAIGPLPSVEPLRAGEFFAGNLADWESAAPNPWHWLRALVDPANSRVLLAEAPATADELQSQLYYEGRFAAIGACSYPRQQDLVQGTLDPLPNLGPFALPVSGQHQINDSLSYDHPADSNLTLTDDLLVQAADTERPYVRISATPADAGHAARFIIDADAAGRSLTIDGLWFGMFEVGQSAVADAAADPMEVVIELAGDFDSVTFRNLTLDPGGERARFTAGQTFVIPTIRLELSGAIDRLVIDKCITGPIEEAENASDQCSANVVCITDSIVFGFGSGVTKPDWAPVTAYSAGDLLTSPASGLSDAEPGIVYRATSNHTSGADFDSDFVSGLWSSYASPAFRGRYATLEVARSTFFGDIEAARFHIEDSIIQGTASAQDAQSSCIRYSAAVETTLQTLPNAYRCVTWNDAMPKHFFVSRRFGDPGLAQLSETAPESIRRGAENTSEMGAYNNSLDAIKRDDLIFKLAEFTAINTITELVFET